MAPVPLPAKASALLLQDLQNDLLKGTRPVVPLSGTELITNCQQLLTTARAVGLLVVYVRVSRRPDLKDAPRPPLGTATGVAGPSLLIEGTAGSLQKSGGGTGDGRKKRAHQDLCTCAPPLSAPPVFSSLQIRELSMTAFVFLRTIGLFLGISVVVLPGMFLAHSLWFCRRLLTLYIGFKSARAKTPTTR